MGRGPRALAVTAACAATASVLAGCPSTPVVLGREVLSGRAERPLPPDQVLRQANPAVPSPDAPASAGVPRIRIRHIEDRRPDPSFLGSLGARHFSSTELTAWIDQELSELRSPTFAVAPADVAAPPAALTLSPLLLKAYVTAQATTKTAVVVLQVDFVAPGGHTVAKIYRGQDTGLNWANGEIETAMALASALQACLEQLRLDVEAQLAAAPRA